MDYHFLAVLFLLLTFSASDMIPQSGFALAGVQLKVSCFVVRFFLEADVVLNFSLSLQPVPSSKFSTFLVSDSERSASPGKFSTLIFLDSDSRLSTSSGTFSTLISKG